MHARLNRRLVALMGLFLSNLVLANQKLVGTLDETIVGGSKGASVAGSTAPYSATLAIESDGRAAELTLESEPCKPVPKKMCPMVISIQRFSGVVNENAKTGLITFEGSFLAEKVTLRISARSEVNDNTVGTILSGKKLQATLHGELK
jgi:hypothetical protein